MRHVLPTAKATLSSRGQLVIPIAVREHCGLHSGSEVQVVTREDGVIELRPQRHGIERIFGMLPSTDPLHDDEDIMAAVSADDEATRQGEDDDRR